MNMDGRSSRRPGGQGQRTDCKGGRGEIREQPVIDVGAHRLNRVESQRRPAIYIGMKYTDTRIEPRCEQGYGHLGF